MKFTPKEIRQNVNISQGSPIKEFFVLLGGILGVLFIIYLALGFVLDLVVDKIPPRFEQRLGNFFSRKFHLADSHSPAETEAQKIVNDLAQYIPESDYKFTVHIVDSKEANALALPGGQILVYTGLLKEVQTENELAMVLAHELGHFVHRDHLRGLGRGLVLTLFSSFIFGFDSTVNEFLMRMLLTTDRRFSRKQEAAADSKGLDLLYRRYGHVAGATDFFEHTKDKERIPRFFKFFSTHPLYFERINLLNKRIEMMGYEMEGKVPLDPIFKEEKGD